MPDDTESLAKGQAGASGQIAKHVGTAPVADAVVEHYEEVAEYRIGEGPPPLSLIVMFVLIVLWATLSWIPFFGY